MGLGGIRDNYLRVGRYLLKLSKEVSLPGFRKVPMYFVIRTFYNDITDSVFTLKAAAMAYSFFFSIFPTVIFLFTLLPYFPVEHLQQAVDDMMAEALPYQAYELLLPTMRNTFEKRGLGVMSLAFILLVFSASRGISTMLSAFSKADYENFRRRNFWEQNALSIGLFFGLALVIVAIVTLLIFMEVWLSRVTDTFGILRDYQYYLFNTLNWVMHTGLLFGFMALLYWLSPSRHRKWRFFSPGSVVSAVLFLLAELGLRWYFVNFANYNKVYGSLTAVMVLLVWFYWTSIVLLLGFELNASIDTMSAEQMKQASWREADASKSREM